MTDSSDQKSIKIWVVVVIAIIVIALVGGPILLFFTAGNNENSVANQQQQVTNQQQQQDLQEKINGYQAVLENNPENKDALEGLLQAQLQKGNLEGAIEPLEKLAKIYPEQTAYRILLAQAKQQTGDLDGSAQAYRKVLDDNPGDIRALQGLVTLLLQQEQPQAAVGQLKETLELAKQEDRDINEVEVKLLLAQVYSGMEEFDDAIALYEELTEQNPGDFRPILGKALVLEKQGNDNKATSLYKQALDLAPADVKDQIPQITPLLKGENSSKSSQSESNPPKEMPNLPLEEGEE